MLILDDVLFGIEVRLGVRKLCVDTFSVVDSTVGSE
jgi:hypothetical protein